MSYARFQGDSVFYAYPDEEHNLELNFAEKVCYDHNRKSKCGGHSLNKEQVKQLKNICEKYLKEYGGE